MKMNFSDFMSDFWRVWSSCLPAILFWGGLAVGLEMLISAGIYGTAFHGIEEFRAAFEQRAPTQPPMSLMIIGMMAQLAMSGVILIAFIPIVSERLGKPIAAPWHRFWAVVATQILAGLAIWLGTLALIIPGLIIAVLLTVATPLATEMGPFEALRESVEMVKPNFWLVLGITLLFGLGAGLVVVAVFFGLMGSIMKGELMGAQIVFALLTAVITPTATVIQILYRHHLDPRPWIREDELKRVFD